MTTPYEWARDSGALRFWDDPAEDIYYVRYDLDCFHCWEHVRDFTTWTSCGLETEVPKWAMWYSEYECVLCREVRVLPQGDWPVGGRVYSEGDDE